MYRGSGFRRTRKQPEVVSFFIFSADTLRTLANRAGDWARSASEIRFFQPKFSFVAACVVFLFLLFTFCSLEQRSAILTVPKSFSYLFFSFFLSVSNSDSAWCLVLLHLQNANTLEIANGNGWEMLTPRSRVNSFFQTLAISSV